MCHNGDARGGHGAHPTGRAGKAWSHQSGNRAEREVAEKAAQDRVRGIWLSQVSSLSLSLCVSVSLNKSCKPYSI